MTKAQNLMALFLICLVGLLFYGEDSKAQNADFIVCITGFVFNADQDGMPKSVAIDPFGEPVRCF